jgi:choline dehydrogenase
MAKSPDPFVRPSLKRELPVGAERPARLARRLALARIFAARRWPSTASRRPRPAPASPRRGILRLLRQQGTTIYHIVGNCNMGEDPMAVVDSRLKVRGLTGLRVIDASVMPAVTTANTNAPTIMIAEKGAAMIREDASHYVALPGHS